jgi:hypothetical protein
MAQVCRSCPSRVAQQQRQLSAPGRWSYTSRVGWSASVGADEVDVAGSKLATRSGPTATGLTCIPTTRHDVELAPCNTLQKEHPVQAAWRVPGSVDALVAIDRHDQPAKPSAASCKGCSWFPTVLPAIGGGNPHIQRGLSCRKHRTDRPAVNRYHRGSAYRGLQSAMADHCLQMYRPTTSLRSARQSADR